MKPSLLALVLLFAASASPGSTSHSWAGTSNYFLQSLSDTARDTYLAHLSSSGIRAVRVWVAAQPGHRACVKGSLSLTSALDFETTLGTYNWETLDLLDKTLVAIGKHGMKALISPHDGNLLHGPNGNDAYGQRFSSGYFYEHQDGIDLYDARLRAILSYKDPPLCPRCFHPIKIATGGLGGDVSHGCTFAQSAVGCAELDMVAVHRYAGPESQNPKQWAGSYDGWLKQTGGKLVYVEEWGVNTTRYDVKEEFRTNTQDMNAAGLPWMYWQILPAKECDGKDGDPFGFDIDGSGVDVAGAAKGATSATSKQDWSGIV